MTIATPQRIGGMRLRTILSLAIVLPLFLTGLAVIATMYYNAARRSGEMAERLLASVTARAGQHVQGFSEDAVKAARSLAGLSGRGLSVEDSDQLLSQLLTLLRANPGVTWISFSDPAGGFTGVYRDAQGRLCTNQSNIRGGKTELVEYVVKDDGTRDLLRRDADSGYDPRKRDFYIHAAGERDIVWQPPYVFYGQETPGITCAIAVRAPEERPGETGRLLGVISVDYDLQSLSTFMRQVVASRNSQVMVFTADRVLVAHSSAAVVATSAQNAGKLLHLGDTPDPVTDAFQKSLGRIQLTEDQSEAAQTYLHFQHNGVPYLACVTPVRLAAGPAEFVATVAPVHDFAPTAWQSSGGAIIIVAGAMLAAAIVATMLAQNFTSPIEKLVGISERIGGGDLNVQFQLGKLEEFRRLGQAFELMLVNLRDWMRVRTSLQIAMEVQRNLLPQKTPSIKGFDIAGYSAYCDETGGDYYDYILFDSQDRRNLIVALGDVMGHGLPSALLMAGARGILRSSVQMHVAPGVLLTRLNSLLFQDTGGTRFMTMVLVCFELGGKKCTWASAGHDPPLIFDPEFRQFLEPEGGDVPLAILADVEYGSYTLDEPRAGQVIFIGSDGVWEMFNAEGELFGKERLRRVIAETADGSAEQIKETVLAALRQFAGSTAAKDDVTFVVIKVA